MHEYKTNYLSLIFITIFLASTSTYAFAGGAVDKVMESIPVISWIYGIPDWDISLSKIPIIGWFVTHRSILTHNALFPVLAGVILMNFGGIGKILAFIVAAIFAIHFVDDMFPVAWKGFAFLHIPILGRLQWIPLDGDWIPIIFSFSWLGINSLLCFSAFFKNE